MDRLFDTPTSDPPRWESNLARERRAELEEGLRLRDQGVERASYATWGPWKHAAWRWIETQPSGAVLTSDDLTDAVGPPVASSRGAVGALIRKAATAGLIEESGYVVSRRAVARGRRILEWRRTGGTG